MNWTHFINNESNNLIIFKWFFVKPPFINCMLNILSWKCFVIGEGGGSLNILLHNLITNQLLNFKYLCLATWMIILLCQECFLLLVFYSFILKNVFIMIICLCENHYGKLVNVKVYLLWFFFHVNSVLVKM